MIVFETLIFNMQLYLYFHRKCLKLSCTKISALHDWSNLITRQRVLFYFLKYPSRTFLGNQVLTYELNTTWFSKENNQIKRVRKQHDLYISIRLNSYNNCSFYNVSMGMFSLFFNMFLFHLIICLCHDWKKTIEIG